MTKELFCRDLATLRDYGHWTIQLTQFGVELDFDTPLAEMVDRYIEFLTDGNRDWDYDTEKEISWIIEFIYDLEFEYEYKNYERGGRTWDLSKPCQFYDFLVYMNEHNWED